MIARIVLVSITGLALCTAIGCSKSSTTQASFESSSNIASSPFKSSSKSSSRDDEKDQKEGEQSEKKETSFERDVRNYTVEFAETGDEADVAAFQRGLGSIAEAHGIADWERTQDTFTAIGRGIGESSLADTHAKQLAVALSNDDYDHLMLIRSGMESRRSP